jgi:membrane-anchored glycerophosphoryl diester phosphodiesterase (GDPDase)
VFRRYAVLTVVLFAYLIMSLLIIQQGRTIHSQQALIRQLFRDSLELNAMKMEQAHRRK